MRVLITGAGGNLGRVLAPALHEQGHEPVLFDMRPLETPFTSVLGDVTNKGDVLDAAQGADAIVHAAALHGIHLPKYPVDDFWRLNVTGTYHVYEAAREHGIGKVLLCSTMGVYGASLDTAEEQVPVVTEDLPLLPKDVYGLSKKLAEELARFYSRSAGIRTIAYRLGMFVPENLVQYGFRLLKGGVDDRDVASAFLLGLVDTRIEFDAFNIMATVPFSPEEFAQLQQSSELLEERFPGIADLVESRGFGLQTLLELWGFKYWSIDKARRILGYEPQHNFTEFYAALQQGRDEYYPFANLPWWGV